MKIETVALFSPGEMGTSMAKMLIKHGVKVVTSLDGRSERTRRIAQENGITDMGSLGSAIMEADIALSVVVPDAAIALGEAIAGAIRDTGKAITFVDANAISPMSARHIAGQIESAGGRFVDACIIGFSYDWAIGKTSLYTSGEDAKELLTLSKLGLPTEVLGTETGQASAFKMLYAGLTKGIASLAMEQMSTAHRLGLYQPIMAKYRHDFPELTAFIERFVPGFPFRAERRAVEMAELASLVKETGLKPRMSPASQQMLQAIADLKLRQRYTDEDEASWSLGDVIKILAQNMAEA